MIKLNWADIQILIDTGYSHQYTVAIVHNKKCENAQWCNSQVLWSLDVAKEPETFADFYKINLDENPAMTQDEIVELTCNELYYLTMNDNVLPEIRRFLNSVGLSLSDENLTQVNSCFEKSVKDKYYTFSIRE